MKQQVCTTCGNPIACYFLGFYVKSESRIFKLLSKILGSQLKKKKVPLSHCESCINDMQVKIGIQEARFRHIKNSTSSATATETWLPSRKDVHFDSRKLLPIHSIMEMSDDIKRPLLEQQYYRGYYDIATGMFVVLKEDYCRGDTVLQGVTPNIRTWKEIR